MSALKKLIKDTVNGLYYLHARSLYHHDIKPVNILYIKLTDTHMLAEYGLIRKFDRKGTKKTMH